MQNDQISRHNYDLMSEASPSLLSEVDLYEPVTIIYRVVKPVFMGPNIMWHHIPNQMIVSKQLE